jgi:hypothetical protein
MIVGSHRYLLLYLEEGIPLEELCEVPIQEALFLPAMRPYRASERVTSTLGRQGVVQWSVGNCEAGDRSGSSFCY